jgi:uncharacterized membrane protein
VEPLVAMLTQRPYVVAFFVTFALLAWCERGPVRAGLWLVIGTALGWLSEFSSVNTGFPFGGYVYHKEAFATELWLGPVPLFASVSFAFMSYFAFSAARRLLSTWTGTGLARSTPDVESLDASPRTLLLAAVVGTWMDVVIDPITLLGKHWFLGDLYHYDPPGAHFGVPLTNYGGWLITIGSIVLANQLTERVLRRAGVTLRRGPVLPLEPLWGIGTCAGNFLFMLSINVLLLARGTVPAEAALTGMLASGVTAFALFLGVVTLMIRRGRALRPATAVR